MVHTRTAVRAEVADGVATLTLDSPHNRNALSGALVEGLLTGLAEATADAGVRAVVITHTGGTFCAGADLTEAGASPAGRTEQMANLMRAILECPKPVIGRIDGHVRAGGLGIVTACDMAVAGPGSTFAVTEARLGLAPAIISLTVLARMDGRAAGRYLLTGETFGPERAADIGIVTLATPDPVAAVAEICAALLSASPQGLAESKALLTREVLASFDARAEELAATSARLFASEEAREGMMAFFEKRAPRWARQG